MKHYRKNSVLAHMLWQKKQETRRDFFNNLLRLQRDCAKKNRGYGED